VPHSPLELNLYHARVQTAVDETCARPSLYPPRETATTARDKLMKR